MTEDEFQSQVERPPDARRDVRVVCRRCGFNGNLSQIGDHWLRNPDHAPNRVKEPIE